MRFTRRLICWTAIRFSQRYTKYKRIRSSESYTSGERVVRETSMLHWLVGATVRIDRVTTPRVSNRTAGGWKWKEDRPILRYRSQEPSASDRKTAGGASSHSPAATDCLYLPPRGSPSAVLSCATLCEWISCTPRTPFCRGLLLSDSSCVGVPHRSGDVRKRDEEAWERSKSAHRSLSEPSAITRKMKK